MVSVHSGSDSALLAVEISGDSVSGSTSETACNELLLLIKSLTATNYTLTHCDNFEVLFEDFTLCTAFSVHFVCESQHTH